MRPDSIVAHIASTARRRTRLVMDAGSPSLAGLWRISTLCRVAVPRRLLAGSAPGWPKHALPGRPSSVSPLAAATRFLPKESNSSGAPNRSRWRSLVRLRTYPCSESEPIDESAVMPEHGSISA